MRRTPITFLFYHPLQFYYTKQVGACRSTNGLADPGLTMPHTRTKIFLILLPLFVILALTGCRKPEPARLMVQIEGELFSDALLWIDGRQVGKLTKTTIKTDGQLFMDDQYMVTLPPGHKDIPSQDQCTGTLDSLELKPGKYVLLLHAGDGQSLQLNATLASGINAITYDSVQQIVKLNDAKMKAAPGTTVTLP